MTKHDVLAALHELVGHCGHCGERSCPGRDSHSTLPKMLSAEDVFRALKMAKRAARKRRQCARDTAWISNPTGAAGGEPAAPPHSYPTLTDRDIEICARPKCLSPRHYNIHDPERGGHVFVEPEEASKAEARGDVSQEARSPLTAVRECADAAQAGDATAARSASPLHASSERGAAGELPGLGLAALDPAAPSELSALHEYMPSTSDGQTWRCFICGGGELSIRHAGKPVTKGGNP